MNQNNASAGNSAHGRDDIVVEPQTLRRLDSIQKDGESCDETLNRVLDIAVEEVPIEEVITDLLSEFVDAVNINVEMVPTHANPARLVITVHTGNVGFEENVCLYEGKEVCALIESQAGEQYSVPFGIIATCDGPKTEMMETTPVYMTDDVLGVEPVALDDGLDRLRTKIGKSTDELRELIYDQ